MTSAKTYVLEKGKATNASPDAVKTSKAYFECNAFQHVKQVYSISHDNVVCFTVRTALFQFCFTNRAGNPSSLHYIRLSTLVVLLIISV